MSQIGQCQIGKNDRQSYDKWYVATQSPQETE